MLIVAGHLVVDPADRDAYVAQSRSVVRQARAAAGCLAFAITADPLDEGRVLVYERWDSEAELLDFRGSGPDDETAAQVLDADVRRYVVSAVEDP